MPTGLSKNASGGTNENERQNFEPITTNAAVAQYEATGPVFEGVLREVRELSKKKPEATMSKGKVALVNRVLKDLLVFLASEPAGKYLELLADDDLPQMSDAVLTMVQFESALKSFKQAYFRNVIDLHGRRWVTAEIIKEWGQ